MWLLSQTHAALLAASLYKINSQQCGRNGTLSAVPASCGLFAYDELDSAMTSATQGVYVLYSALMQLALTVSDGREQVEEPFRCWRYVNITCECEFF